MRAKLLTLRFSPQLGRFDDAPLLALQQKVVLEHLREHLVQVGHESMLVCMATWRERTDLQIAASPRPVGPRLRRPEPSAHDLAVGKSPAEPLAQALSPPAAQPRHGFAGLQSCTSPSPRANDTCELAQPSE